MIVYTTTNVLVSLLPSIVNQNNPRWIISSDEWTEVHKKWFTNFIIVDARCNESVVCLYFVQALSVWFHFPWLRIRRPIDSKNEISPHLFNWKKKRAHIFLFPLLRCIVCLEFSNIPTFFPVVACCLLCCKLMLAAAIYKTLSLIIAYKLAIAIEECNNKWMWFSYSFHLFKFKFIC